MLDVTVIEEPAAAEASLDPIRSRILAALSEPGSAAMLAARLGLPRQKVNYHLKELERHGLVELVEERRKGNVTERVYSATAASYVISPVTLAAVSPDPDRAPDRLSARWLLALGSRLIQEVGALLTGSARAGKPVTTFAMDAKIRFASAADRAAFADELTRAVTTLVSRYHDENATGGREHRLVVGLHPIPTARPDDPGDPHGLGDPRDPGDPSDPHAPGNPHGPGPAADPAPLPDSVAEQEDPR
ncbi:helix-turn-helix transcriptional regulator [Catenulispora sp. NF23]|uniref:Helix-turn-helix transcriptional regulator n=1 Tax=Catenulispora pinistramenti TaxID=2705254 RepID=A0ABS5KVD7_9ACTN|nr:helix-turn-helix domain-containing protein [Catenulispora pinistramenti]MBS2535006.1 helix-turn-helix transcriptional regulator [Catenulispora pinistramenti]MBS2550006.1 helix-turn-helix transcriptional regulator [Catenulispora pinistramenti]